jgi:hypothetical protein
MITQDLYDGGKKAIDAYFDSIDKAGLTPLMAQGLRLHRALQQTEVWPFKPNVTSRRLKAMDVGYLRNCLRWMERKAERWMTFVQVAELAYPTAPEDASLTGDYEDPLAWLKSCPLYREMEKLAR